MTHAAPQAISSPAWRFATLSPTDKHAAITLSDGNLILSGSGAAYTAVRSTLPITMPVYFEGVINSTGNQANGHTGMGIATAAASLGTYVGGDAAGWSGQQNQYGIYKYNSDTPVLIIPGGTLAPATVQMLAFDPAAGAVWFGAAGSWFQGNPATGASPSYTGISGVVYAAAWAYSVSDSFTLNFGQSNFVYSPPSGFWPLLG